MSIDSEISESMKIEEFFMDSKIRREDGGVFSWENDKKPGYIYQEIIGYFIKWCSWKYYSTKDEKFVMLAKKSADYLSLNISKRGAAFRDDIEYVFDSAMCLSGLMSLAKIGAIEQHHEEAAKRLIKFIAELLGEKKVCLKEGVSYTDNTRWSLSYGSLIIKCVIGLYEYYEFSNEKQYKRIAESLVRELTDLTFKEDYFTINRKKSWVYTHPHCYATEGLVFLHEKGYEEFQEKIEKSAEWLAKNQNKDGSLFNWYYHDVVCEKQGDATAQAARIWLLVNRKRFRKNIEGALRFLRTLQSEEGGIFYNVGSQDQNAWVSMFASQAFYWYENESQWDWII